MPAAKKPELTDAQKLRASKAEARKLRQALQALSDRVLMFLDSVETAMQGPEGPARGKQIAHLCNELEIVNDGVRYAQLGVDFRTDDKNIAVKRLRAAQPE